MNLPFAVVWMKAPGRPAGTLPSFVAIAALALFCGVPYPLFAGGGDLQRYSSRLWQVEDGLPHNVVRAVAQTRDGYLWVGTHEGLARFDGMRFQRVEYPGLTDEVVIALRATRDGLLWVGTEAGLFRFSEDGVRRFSPEDGLPEQAVRAIHETADGDVWVAVGNLWMPGEHGIYQWYDGRFERRFEGAFQNEVIFGIVADDAGNVWSSGTTVKRLNGESVRTFGSGDGLIGGSPRGVHAGRDGTIWIGTTHGLSRLKDGRFQNYLKGSGPSAYVSAIYEDRNGMLWIGTYEGLSRFVDGGFYDEVERDGASYRVHGFYEDREGNLWVASNEGLTRLSPQRFISFNKRDGLSHSSTRAVCAGEDGSVWFGVWGGGLYRMLDGKPVRQDAGLASPFIYSMHIGRDGALWIGMDYRQGLYRLKDGRRVHYGVREGLTAGVISVVHEDRAGHVWIGSQEGLFRMADGTFARFTAADGLSDNWINTLHEGADGTLWIGTGNGLTLWNGDFVVDERFSGTPILFIHEDEKSRFWIGTGGGGLVRLADGDLNRFTVAEGLPADTIFSIVQDDQERLWMHGRTGIFWVGRAELEAVATGESGTVRAFQYGRRDGIVSSGQHRYTSQPAATRSSDGRLWFRTAHGIVVVDPAEVTVNDLPPPIAIEEVVADRKPVKGISGSEFRVSSYEGNSEHETRNAERQTLLLPPGRGDLEIHYTALSFTAPEGNRFKYKLEGVDADWVNAGGRRVAYYNNIRPGSYTFRVVGANSDGVWNEHGAGLTIVWRPNFWQTWWFSGLLVLSGAGGLAGFWRYFSARRLQRALAAIEQERAVEKERGRIARDMHDDLGARLSEILILSNLPGKESAEPAKLTACLNRVSAAARDLVDNLDAIVWAVNPRHDSVESFVTYAQEYVSNYLEAHSTDCEFEIPVELPGMSLASQVRHDLFLVVKEAINNAVKHAQASKVTLSFSFDAGELSVGIKDDGIGFSLPEVTGAGNGLGNMEQRMKRIGGRFELSSRPGEGVRIEAAIAIEPRAGP